MDYERLEEIYPDYKEGMKKNGYKNVTLVPPTDTADGRIVCEGIFSEQCGAVVGRVEVRCVNGTLYLAGFVTKSAIGNRGWGGGTRSTNPKDARAAVADSCDFLSGVRDLLS